MDVNNVNEAIAAHIRGRVYDQDAAAFVLEEDLPAGPMPASPEALFYPQAVEQRGPGYEAVAVKSFLDRAYAAAPCLLRLVAREFKGVRLVVAGGFCLSVLQGQPVKDMDVFLIAESGTPVRYLDKCCREAAALLNPLRCTYRRGVLELRLADPPYRVQFILRPYDSMSTLLNSFDLAASGVGFDGQKLWVTPASLWCTRARVCPLNPEFRSPSFEQRAEKYFRRKGYALAVPGALAELGAARTLVCGVCDPNKPSLIIEVTRELAQNAFAARACVDGGPLWQYFGEVAGSPMASNAVRPSLREKYDKCTQFNVEKILHAIRNDTPFGEINWLIKNGRIGRQAVFRDVLRGIKSFSCVYDIQNYVVEQLKIYRGLNIRKLLSLYSSDYVRKVLCSHLSNLALEQIDMSLEERSECLKIRGPGGNYTNFVDMNTIEKLSAFIIEHKDHAVDLFVTPGNDSTSSFVPQPTPVAEWLRALPGAPPALALPDAPEAPDTDWTAYSKPDQLIEAFKKYEADTWKCLYDPSAVVALKQMRRILEALCAYGKEVSEWRLYGFRLNVFEREQSYCSVSAKTLDVVAKMLYGRAEADPESLASAWNAAWAQAAAASA